MFEKTFCSSPWFHVRLTYDGSYESCRWANNPDRIYKFNDHSIMEYYNSDQMKTLRLQLLDGQAPDHCSTCYYEESFGKLNGRIRQLNKSAVNVKNFNLTLRSSPHYDNFKYSLENSGTANLAPVDLQIELGNTCNSACIMCTPEASSRLEQDYKKLHKINSELFFDPISYNSWTKDNSLINRFVKEIAEIKNIRYIHFLGGETLYEEAFYTICEELINQGLAKDIIIGTTTNGTIFNQRLQNLITNFKQFHLGVSIESVTNLNDYIRYPGRIGDILNNIENFLKLRNSQPQLYISLRITPTVFSIYEIDQLFEYMLKNHVIAESCNILRDPEHLRIELIPDDIRLEIQQKLLTLIKRYNISKNDVINIRRSDQIDQVTANTIIDYYQFMCNYKEPDNVTQLRINLVKFIKAFETIRGNSILTYLPQYEKFLRNFGYKSK